jgi:hypothetical protein
MIPSFPNFKILDLSDKSDIESYTLAHKPYSDFNFISLWSWDVNTKREVSILNGNLVVIFTDYVTDEKFLSFLGTKKPVTTSHELINYAIAHNIEPILRLVGEEMTNKIKSRFFHIELDRKNFDYIFSTSELSRLTGKRFKSKRQLITRFNEQYPEATFKVQTPTTNLIDTVIKVLQKWEAKKDSDNKEYDSAHEKIAIQKIFEMTNYDRLLLSTIKIKDEICAFGIDELLLKKNAMSHFFKSDYSHKGINEYMNREMAHYLNLKGVKYWNWEQDLDIEGIKTMKMSYRPIRFLKKCTISKK